MRQINKIKLTGKNTADVTYDDVKTGEGSKGAVYPREGKDPIHDDFAAAAKALTIHLAILCDQGTMTEFEDAPTKLEPFEVTGVTYSGEDDHRGVTIIGVRHLKDGGVLNLVAPFAKFDRSHSRYAHVDSLLQACEVLNAEAAAYVQEGSEKIAPSTQYGMFDSEEQTEQKEEYHKNRKQRKIRKSEVPEIDDLGIAVEA